MPPKRPPPAPADQAAPPGGSARPTDGFADEEEENGPWRHPPVAPKDDGIASSIGKAISDVVTGPLDDASGQPKKP